MLDAIHQLSAKVVDLSDRLQNVSSEVQSFGKKAGKRSKTDYRDPNFALVNNVVERMLDAESDQDRGECSTMF
jgi:hypothetical protein